METMHFYYFSSAIVIALCCNLFKAFGIAEDDVENSFQFLESNQAIVFGLAGPAFLIPASTSMIASRSSQVENTSTSFINSKNGSVSSSFMEEDSVAVCEKLGYRYFGRNLRYLSLLQRVGNDCLKEGLVIE